MIISKRELNPELEDYTARSKPLRLWAMEVEVGIYRDVWLCAMPHGDCRGEIQYTDVEKIKGVKKGTPRFYQQRGRHGHMAHLGRAIGTRHAAAATLNHFNDAIHTLRLLHIAFSLDCLPRHNAHSTRINLILLVIHQNKIYSSRSPVSPGVLI